MNLEIQTEICYVLLWNMQSNVPKNSSCVEDIKLHMKFCFSAIVWEFSIRQNGLYFRVNEINLLPTEGVKSFFGNLGWFLRIRQQYITAWRPGGRSAWLHRASCWNYILFLSHLLLQQVVLPHLSLALSISELSGGSCSLLLV